MSRTIALALAVLAMSPARAAAQPTPDPPTPPPPASPTAAPVAPPLQWTTWEVTGDLVDPVTILTALVEPEVIKRRALTEAARTDLAEVFARLGYQLLEIATTRRPDGIHATFRVAPILLVRWVDVDVSARRVFIGDDIRRRLRLRPGEPLPFADRDRQILLDDEVERALAYLRDEGYLEAKVSVTVTPLDRASASVRVAVELGPAYEVGEVTVENVSQTAAPLAVAPEAIRAAFFHRDQYLPLVPLTRPRRFTRAQLQADLDELTRRFQRRGYPAVRVTSDYDPKTSLDRKTKKVDLTIKIDQRRFLDVVFEGNDPDRVPDAELTKVLTFASAATVDDYEVAASARELERYYQSRGYFDTMVSHERVRFRAFDRVVFRIEPGATRAVRSIEMACRGPRGPQPCTLPNGDLIDAVGTRPEGGLALPIFGTATAPTTTAQLAADVAALERLYRDRGFPRVKVTVAVAPTQAGWAAAALAAAELATERRRDDLRVRFSIDEGPRTLISQVNVVFEGAATGDNTAADERAVRERIKGKVKVGAPYVRDDLDAAAQALGDWYWSLGRPRAKVTVPDPIVSADGQAAIVTFNIEARQELRLGEVVVRGNFRTRDWVIREELGFDRGALLTGDLYRGGVARLRASGLFSAVQTTLLGFDDPRQRSVDVLVTVQERNDAWAQAEFELGGSLQSGFFVRAKPSFPNLWGLGIRSEINATYGQLYKAAEASMRFPHWLIQRDWIEFDTEVTAYYRNQVTERFADLVTYGTTLSTSRSWQREANDRHHARLIALALRYDFRLRTREEELVRLAGPGAELETNPIATQTGSVGFTLSWDQRRDKGGALNPLAPHHGFRAEVGASLAHRYLLSQDDFVKVSALAQGFFTAGRVQLRLDGRYDHGVPLGGAVLLPEVERFFAGGDTTVRGFEEDRLATELITSAVPPLGETTQIRVLPAGGNVRALTTADLQVTVADLGVPVATAGFVDAGLVTNALSTVRADDIRPAAGMALRLLTPLGAISGEYAIPLLPRLGDDPRGRFHLSVALRY